MRTEQRRRKNRRKKLIIRTVVCLIFLIAGVIFSLTMFFNINNMVVTGESMYTADEVIGASGVALEDNLIFLSSDKVNKAITQKLPYISNVKVKKHLPSKLELIVEQTTAAYAVPQNGLYILLSKDGKVLEKDIEYVSENIIFLNPGEIKSAELGNIAEMKDPDVMKKVEDITEALNQCGYENITSIDASNIYNVTLMYEGRIKIELGETNSSNLLRKIQFGKTALDRQNEENNQYRGTINLTVDGKGYWSEETTTAPAEESTAEPLSETGKTEETEKNEEQSSKNEGENTQRSG